VIPFAPINGVRDFGDRLFPLRFLIKEHGEICRKASFSKPNRLNPMETALSLPEDSLFQRELQQEYEVF
jgi:hypothetical protein